MRANSASFIIVKAHTEDTELPIEKGLARIRMEALSSIVTTQ